MYIDPNICHMASPVDKVISAHISKPGQWLRSSYWEHQVTWVTKCTHWWHPGVCVCIKWFIYCRYSITVVNKWCIYLTKIFRRVKPRRYLNELNRNKSFHAYMGKNQGRCYTLYCRIKYYHSESWFESMKILTIKKKIDAQSMKLWYHFLASSL